MAPGRARKNTSASVRAYIDEAGYLLTNWHVVSRASRVQVKLWDGREDQADIISATPGRDVALLK